MHAFCGALALLVFSISAAAHPPAGCPTALVPFEPERWAGHAVKATTCPQVAAALRMAGIAPITCDAAAAPASVHDAGVSPPWRSVEGREVRLVTAVVEVEGSPQEVRSVLLRVKPRRWCRVELPALDAVFADTVVTSTAVVQLLAPERDALHLQAEERTGATIGCRRGPDTLESWWEVSGLQLRPLLTVTSWSSTFSACHEEGSSTARTVSWSATFPRVANITTTTTTTVCREPEEQACETVTSTAPSAVSAAPDQTGALSYID